MPKPSVTILEKIAEPAHIPGISYAYLEPKEGGEHGFESTLLAVGKKSAQGTDAGNIVDGGTTFPASSVSKIVFTYLVLQLVKYGQIDLDEPLLPILQREHQEYERFKVNGEYPEKATQITARDVLSHTTGLPNFVGPKLSPTLKFNESPLGTGYLYSGESLLFLQIVLEAKTGKNLEELAKKYVFNPLKMERSTFLPQPKDDPNIVMVHTELEKPFPIEKIDPPICAAGSLLTTANDFSKLMNAWLEQIDDPIIKQAFEFETSVALSGLTLEEFHSLFDDDNTKTYLKSATDSNYRRVPFSKTELDELKRAIDESTQTEIKALSAKLVIEPTRPYKITQTCGLGWHIYRDNDKVIAYQYGENPNTRSFIALNVTDKKGAVFFTNSENGMSIANQVLSSSKLAPIGDMQSLFMHMPHYTQCDEPGWQATIEGKIYEDKGHFAEARSYFLRAAEEASPNDKSKQQRLDWFDAVHLSPGQTFTQPLEAFEGVYTNPYGEKREIYIKNGDLMCKEFEREIKLVRISETEFLPETNQDFKIRITKDQVTIHFLHSDPKFIFEQSLPESQEHSAFFAALSKLINQPAYEVQTQHADRAEVAVTEAEDADNLASARALTQRFRNTLGCTLVDVASGDAKDLAPALPTEARVVTLEELSADELLAAGGRKQSSNARIPHAAPTPTAGVAEDETQENDNSSAP